MNPAAPSAGQSGPPGLVPGDKVRAAVISSGGKGNVLLNVKGVLTEAAAEGGEVPGKSVRVLVTATEPALQVKILPESPSGAQPKPLSWNAFLKALTEGGNPADIKAAKTALLKEAAPVLAREAASFDMKEVVKILKNLGGARIAAFIPEEIKKIIKDGGNFFENKLLKGFSPEKDAKFLAYSDGNDAARSALTKMQIANILFNGDVFTFFDGEDGLDFDNGVMRFRKSPSGDISLYVRLDFSNLGETLVSFVKGPENGYYITVRTEKDISGLLASADIAGCRVRWAQKGSKDGGFFNICREDFTIFDNFDIKA